MSKPSERTKQWRQLIWLLTATEKFSIRRAFAIAPKAQDSGLCCHLLPYCCALSGQLVHLLPSLSPTEQNSSSVTVFWISFTSSLSLFFFPFVSLTGIHWCTYLLHDFFLWDKCRNLSFSSFQCFPSPHILPLFLDSKSWCTEIICPVFVYLANYSSHLLQPFWITTPHIACHSSHSFCLTLLYPKLVTECCQNCYSISQTAVFCCDNRLMYAPERTHSLHIKYLQCCDKHNQVFKYFKKKLTWRFKIGNNWKEIIPN